MASNESEKEREDILEDAALDSCLCFEYVFCCHNLMQVLGLVFYVIVAALHTNRQRPDGDSYHHQQMIIEDQINSSRRYET